MLLKFPSLVEKAQFLLVCGPGDPSLAGSNSGHGNVLPKPPIAAVFTSKLKEVLGSSLTVSSNPARVLYCGKELVFLREDLLNKMRRSCIVPPSEHETSGSSLLASCCLKKLSDSSFSFWCVSIEVSEHLVKTICDQAHLSPLPLVLACALQFRGFSNNSHATFFHRRLFALYTGTMTILSECIHCPAQLF